MAAAEAYTFDGDVCTIALLRPFNFEGIKQTHVSLHELTVEETLELERTATGKTNGEQDVTYFAKMAGKPSSFFMTMKERDWRRVKNAYWETLGNVELPATTSE